MGSFDYWVTRFYTQCLFVDSVWDDIFRICQYVICMTAQTS